MNRIILIGNGFDLAHGLETGYKHFINKFWANIYKELCYSKLVYENEFVSIKVISRLSDTNYCSEYHSFKEILKQSKAQIIFKNSFLEIISESLSLKNWVDIEEEYYQQMKDIVQGKSQYYKYDIRENPEAKMAIAKLNDDFKKIKQELEKYLLNIAQKTSKIEAIYNLFYDGFKLKDIVSSKENLLIEYIFEMLYSTENDKHYKELQNKIFKRTKELYGDVEKEYITDYLKNHYFNDNKDTLEKEEYVRPIYPCKTLVLNFNYTETVSKYLKNTHYLTPSFQTIHIHGKLNNGNNPIIFGYGDESADEYKEIEKLNDNEYFKNIKSIEYLKTDNYKRLLSFADSDYFQIYIFGHSCGNSDRTLLKTLFEHEKCVSIKPFFHEKIDENGKLIDDYEDITINMSRNFNHKAIFRERVVNKSYCEPLPQK